MCLYAPPCPVILGCCWEGPGKQLLVFPTLTWGATRQSAEFSPACCGHLVRRCSALRQVLACCLCQEWKRIDLPSLFAEGCWVLCSDRTAGLHRSNWSTQVLKLERSCCSWGTDRAGELCCLQWHSCLVGGESAGCELGLLLLLTRLLSAKKRLREWNA